MVAKGYEGILLKIMNSMLISIGVNLLYMLNANPRHTFDIRHK